MVIKNFTRDDRYAHVTIRDTRTNDYRHEDFLGWAVVELEGGETFIEPVALIDGAAVVESEHTEIHQYVRWTVEP